MALGAMPTLVVGMFGAHIARVLAHVGVGCKRPR
jgi:hypothetical protein